MADKRSSFLLLLDTNPSGSANYQLVGDGVTELTISYNAQSKTEQYINADSASTDITGYQPNAPVTMVANKGDAIYDYINSLRKTRAVLSECYTHIIMVDMLTSPTAGAYESQKQPVSIQIDSFGGAAADPLSISFTINFRGEDISGTFNPTTKVFTPTASYDCTLSALTLTGGTLTPVFSSAKTVYTASASGTTSKVVATATASTAKLLLHFNGAPVAFNADQSLTVGENTFEITVANGTERKKYIIAVTK